MGLTLSCLGEGGIRFSSLATRYGIARDHSLRMLRRSEKSGKRNKKKRRRKKNRKRRRQKTITNLLKADGNLELESDRWLSLVIYAHYLIIRSWISETKITK